MCLALQLTTVNQVLSSDRFKHSSISPLQTLIEQAVDASPLSPPVVASSLVVHKVHKVPVVVAVVEAAAAVAVRAHPSVHPSSHSSDRRLCPGNDVPAPPVVDHRARTARGFGLPLVHPVRTAGAAPLVGPAQRAGAAPLVGPAQRAGAAPLVGPAPLGVPGLVRMDMGGATNEKKWETNEKKWETNERKWETSQPGTRPQAPSLGDK